MARTARSNKASCAVNAAVRAVAEFEMERIRDLLVGSTGSPRRAFKVMRGLSRVE